MIVKSHAAVAAFVALFACSAAQAQTARLQATDPAAELATKRLGQEPGAVTPTPLATVTYTGTIGTAPTFNRPIADCTALSGVGTAVGYDARTMTVDVTGAYTITVTTFGGDSFLHLYSPSFNAAAPLTGCITGDDDGGAVPLSRITTNLTAGTQYVVVTSTFGNGETGNYTNTVDGPGTATIGAAAVQANLGITIAAPSGVATSGAYTYLVTASNAGPGAATGAVATINIGAGATITGTTCTTTGSGGSRTWAIGGLANGANATCTVNVTAPGPTCSGVLASASITGTTLDPSPGNNASSTTNQPAFPDGGYEGGTPSATWAEASTNFGTTICSVAACGDGSGTATPRTGTFWAWFGGFPGGTETGSLQQSVVIPTGTTTLSFQSRLGTCAAANGAMDFVRLTIDGTEVWRRNASDASCGAAAYTLNNINVSALAGPTPRVIRFESTTIGNGTASNFSIDDVSWNAPPVCTGPVGTPGLSLVKRVQTSNNVANCPTAGATVSVPAGTSVYYCYRATNTGTLPLQTHTVTDTAFGAPVANNLQLTLAPAAASPWVISPAVVVTGTTSSAATWSACAQAGNCTGAPAGSTATASVAAGATTASVQQSAASIPALDPRALALLGLLMLGLGFIAFRRN